VELDDRKAKVLEAVVHDFIQSDEPVPVGSKTLVEKYALGVSPATVRNELASLEELGYLSHPHTSAGRIPTERGYRWYVDSLSGVGSLARAQEDSLIGILTEVGDLEEVMLRASLLLASLTQLTAMVASPAVNRARLKHIELVSLAPSVVLVVLIVDSGQVEKRLVELEQPAAPSTLEDVRLLLNAELDGVRLEHAQQHLAGMGDRVRPGHLRLFRAVAAVIGQMVNDQSTRRVFVGGQANIAAGAFPALETVKAVFEALEQQVLLLQMLQEAMDSGSVSVTIGSENTIESIRDCSLVTASYPAGGATGNIGVLGPTRMDYLRAMTAVQAVARHLGGVLDDAER
jgi:heat-inducible transcriptional repressor